MRTFLRKNSILSVCFCIALFICILYILTINQKEMFPHAGDWFNLLFQLSVGFVINFVFFVTQIYIPQYKLNKEAYTCILVRIEKIAAYMRSIFVVLNNRYMDSYDEDRLDSDYLLKLLRMINTGDKVNMINVRKSPSPLVSEDEFYTVKEWINTQVAFVERDIDMLMKYYVPYISPELMKTLESILNSSMHNNLARVFMQVPSNVPFGSFQNDSFLKPYFDLMKRLEAIELHYKL